MWFWFSLIALICWSGSDLFSKIGCQDADDKYSHLKMVMAVGLVMGLHAAYEIFINGTEISGSIATSAQLGKLGLYVEEQLRRMVRELASGNIDADPWARSEQDSACTYCEFAPACHFENGCGGDRIEYIHATGAEQLWEHVDRTIGEGGKRDG